jgi:inosine-uridine nucleoside N-ribohydrolase
LRLTQTDDSLTSQVLAAEIDALNAEFVLSQSLEVIVAPCGEANAFYDPAALQIIFCSEFEAHLETLAGSL